MRNALPDCAMRLTVWSIPPLNVPTLATHLLTGLAGDSDFNGLGERKAFVDGDSLFDVYFVTQVGPNELWRNLGGGRFEEITQRAGVAVADRIGVTASFGDIDNDGDPDLYVTTVRGGNVPESRRR